MVRKAILTITLVVLFLLFVLYSGSNLFKINDGFKQLVIAKIQSVAGNECTVENIRLGFGSLNLKKVRLVFPDAPYKLEIDELQLGYSIRSLLKGRSTPEKTADEITIYKPRLTLLYDPRKEDYKDVDLSLKLSREAEALYRSLIKESDFIKRITISKGEIEIENTETNERVRLAKRINGWAYTDEQGRAWLRLAGNLFDTQEYNMVIYGQFDLQRGGLDYINVDLHNYELGNELPFLLPSYFEVLSGQMEGHLTITERLEPSRGFDIEGTVNLQHGSFKVQSENLYFDDVELEAEIREWNIEIKKATQTINGSPTEITGRINNLLDPHFDLRLRSRKFDVEKFLDQFLPEKKLPFKGVTALDVAVTDAFATPRIQGTLASDHLQFYGRKLRDLDVELALDNSTLIFRRMTGHVDETTFAGSGEIDFKVPENMLDFEINVRGDVTRDILDLGLSSPDSCLAAAHIKVFGTMVNPVSTGEVDLHFLKDGSPSLSVDGSFSYSQETLVINTSSIDDDFHLNATVQDILHERIYDFEATNFQKLFEFVNDAKLAFLQSRYNLNVAAEGTADDLQVVVEGYRRTNYEKVFQIAISSQAEGPQGTVRGDIVLLPNRAEITKGSFALDWTEERLRLQELELGEWLTGSFDICKSDTMSGQGKLAISGMSLSLFLSLLGSNTAEKYEGDIYGQVTLNHQAQAQRYSGSLWLLNGFLDQLGPVRAQLTFEADPSTIQVKKLTLNDAEALNIVAEGEYDLSTQELETVVAATGLQIEELLRLLTHKKSVVSGEAVIQVTAKGKFPRLPLYGNVRVHNARILKLQFDEVLLDFGDQAHQNGSYLSTKALNVGRAEVKKGDEFVLQGSGYLPLEGGRSLDLALAGDGNFLALLPDLAQIFQESHSQGHLDLRMKGGYTKPDFTGSELHFEKGELTLTNVARKIEDLEAELAVEGEDYFLNIKNLHGTIRDEPFFISNTRETAGLNHGLYEALRLGGDDLSLGALLLTTSKKGVPLHIPGLMESGEIGWYALEGYTPDEKFFVAGPWRRPYVRGKVRIRNANLMYPFDESIGEPNPVVVNIMNNINWDIYAVSEKETRYVRQFPAIYVDMEVDRDISKLEFKGVLKDSTFTIGGTVESTRGEIEYLDLNFRVDKMGAEFIPSSFYPIVYGKAWTVIRDSSNVPSDVYLTLLTVDDVTHQEVKSGSWDRINIKLSSEHPGFDETQGDIMATLGYSSETIDEQAAKAVGSSTDKLLFRPLMRPLERQLERKLALDVVRFSYSIAQNFLDSRFSNEALGSSLAFLRSSRLILGKYLLGDVYVLYTGEIKTGIDYQYQDKGVGLQHILGLEYRLNSKWLLQAEYDYNTLLETHRDDKRVWLRHSFLF